MKKTKIIYYAKIYLVIINILIFLVACNKNVVPGNAKGKRSPNSLQQKTVNLENFNYLFIEGLKQKIFGNYEKALKYFSECEKIKEDDAVEYQMSGLFALGGVEEKAVYYGQKSIKNAPENIWYYYQLASVYKMFGKNDSVIYVYKKITKTFPLMVKEKVRLGDLYSENRKHNEAIKIYTEVEKKYGKNSELGKKIIHALINAGKNERALEKINRQVQLFGSDKEILLMKAVVLENLGKYKEGNDLYAKLMKSYPNDIEVEKAVYKKYLNAKEFEKAVRYLKKLVYNKQVGGQEKIDYLFQIIDQSENIFTKKDTILFNMVQTIYNENRKDLRSNLLMVDYYSRNKEYQKSKKVLNNIIEKYPLFNIGWRQMLLMLENLNENDSIIIYADKGRQLFPEDPFYDLYLCIAFLKSNKNDKVIKYAKEGIAKIKPKGFNYIEKASGLQYKILIVQFYGYLGEAYKNLKEFRKSDEAFENGLKINPEDDYLLNNYSYYLSLRKVKLDKALKMSKKTIRKNPNNPTYLDTYGWILFNIGNINDAEKYIEKALRYGGNKSPEILEHYGSILYKKGDVKGAIKYWQNAIDNGGAKKRLEERIQNIIGEDK